jgi:endonuclease/exonuclease/phosphatase family metal-dependent hydrolase
MPAFTGAGASRLKRLTWDWLTTETFGLLSKDAIIAGDFNTAVGDGRAKCGDCLEAFARSWTHALPPTGHSWRHRPSQTEHRIDHAFLTLQVALRSASYSWEFQQLSEEAQLGNTGRPDHAMLIVDFDLRH